MKPFVLGIAGYIGSGKTTAGKYFETLGAKFIDADAVVDGLYQKGEDGYRKVLSFFGDDYVKKDGELNRKKLAQSVFGDPKKLRILHDLIHPLVTNKIMKMIDEEKLKLAGAEGRKVFVIEATYFEKKHLKALVDRLLWIDTPKPLLFERLHKSRQLERPLFEKILRIQIKPEDIQIVVENNRDLESFYNSLKKVWEELT